MKVDKVEKKVKMQTSHNYSASSLILRPHPLLEHGEDLLGYEPKFNTLFFFLPTNWHAEKNVAFLYRYRTCQSLSSQCGLIDKIIDWQSLAGWAYYSYEITYFRSCVFPDTVPAQTTG